MNNVPFRLWLNELWLQNCEERMLYKECTYKMQEYFTKYKWWLRREYRYHQNKGIL